MELIQPLLMTYKYVYFLPIIPSANQSISGQPKSYLPMIAPLSHRWLMASQPACLFSRYYLTRSRPELVHSYRCV